MIEKETIFSEMERENIASQAIELARAGEDAIADVVSAKNMLWGARIAAFAKGKTLFVTINDRKIRLSDEQAMHEVKVMTEIIRQARAMLQFARSDDESIIEHYKNQGNNIQSV